MIPKIRNYYFINSRRISCLKTKNKREKEKNFAISYGTLGYNDYYYY